MTRHRWFLPDEPDVLGMMQRQITETLGGLDALAAWAAGDVSAAAGVREAERRGEQRKREVIGAISTAFVTPIEPEDLFALSQGIDWLLSRSRDLVNEAEAMDMGPDEVIAEMVAMLADSLREIEQAIARLASDPPGRPRTPTRRSKPSARSSASTTRAWLRCSRTPASASGSHAASSIATSPGSVRQRSRSPSG